MPDIQTYDSSKVVVVVGGVSLTGFADGSFLSIEEMTDGISSMAGADGEVARSMSNDPRVKIDITLMQTSLSNILLSTLYRTDKISGAGVVPILIEDLMGGALFASGQAWINKNAVAGYSKEVGTRAWTITAVQRTLASFVFGSAA